VSSLVSLALLADTSFSSLLPFGSQQRALKQRYLKYFKKLESEVCGSSR
jgi:hypothetical protein